jgi:DNA invertase Pin-like site-specific DNA recombinase
MKMTQSGKTMTQPNKKTINPQSENPLLKALRENVKKLNDSGFTWQEIAGAAGIHRQQLRRIVLYGQEPTFTEAENIAQAMKELVEQRIAHLRSSADLNLIPS